VTELLPAGRPLLVAAGRVLPAGLVLLAIGRFLSSWRPCGRREWATTIGLALANFGVFFPLLIVAGYRLPGGVAASVGGTQPLLVIAFSWLIVGRRSRLAEVVIGVAAVIGVSLVVIRPGAEIDPVGVVAALGANVSFSIGVVLTRRQAPPANRLAATGWQLLISGMLLLPLAIVAEGAPPAITTRNAAGFAYLSLIGTAVAFVLWFNGVRRLHATAPPLLGLAAPVTGVVMGWLVLSESLSSLQILGFGVTVAAITHGAFLQAETRSVERGDRVADGEDTASVVDVEVLDHPAVDRDHALAQSLGRLECLDHAT
jgi:probable blue pigment (indigoidine) exporter